jgi:hypothetical protein
MDGRGHPATLTPSYFGHSSGRWEGDRSPSTPSARRRGRAAIRLGFTRGAELFEYQSQENNFSPDSMVGDALTSTVVP